MDNQTNQNCKLILIICPIQAPKSWHSWVWAPWLPCEGHNWLWHRGPASWDEMEGTGSHPVFQICFEQRRQQPIKIELDNLLEKNTHTHTHIIYILLKNHLYDPLKPSPSIPVQGAGGIPGARMARLNLKTKLSPVP